ncbi:hypothetical protein RA210_U10629 [Rubrivivax sp. A210]|uniref:TRAP transporter substrate-binding protein DctP n=1 Tax=Rubrivivax sp. A210 TaxID=2772301 RepID=UPI0019192215|nr:TRAP transporter substrate-binding protein DctP [Rubrivivax sp. A210]CAD5367045.1 hypothetical protein RA210_U10629 [Rubrivivax sp. A210]
MAMAIDLDHLIVPARDRVAAARQLATLLGVPWAAQGAVGPFSPVYVSDGLTLDFDEWAAPTPQLHYCFRVGPAEFDAILGRIKAAGIANRSLPHGTDDRRVNAAFGGRLVYWSEPDGPFGKLLLSRLPDKGLVSLGFWDLGFRNVANSRRPITRAEDMDGLKLRAIPNPVFVETFKAMKANRVPLAFAELYGALEARAVDGQENPYAVILSNKFYEVQKYVSATKHVYATNILLVSKIFWDKLSPAEQKILNDAANESRAYQRQVSRAAAQRAQGELQTRGMQFNAPAPAELRRMSQIAKPVTDKLAATYDPSVLKLYNDELARVRK